MKFLLIGNGFIAPTHKEAIRNIGGEIVGVVDRDQGEEKWKEEVRKTDADCIVILTPNDLHFEMAKFSSENGKIVLCEKPLTIKSEDARILMRYHNIFTVCQLRYHPLAKKLKSEIQKDKKYEIEMNISVHRDENYYKSWKGIKERSGGLLFNLGIHYFDLLLYLFGPANIIKVNKIYEKNNTEPEAEAIGEIEGENYTCGWHLCINKKEDGDILKKREFIINGASYNFSSKDNLAEENLHKFVYQNLLKGKGVAPSEALKSIELVERIYNS